jgi:solute carrier family 25 carnitine/acylcarnitine transporter 20/29
MSKDTLNNFIFGGLSGMASILITHPIDTIKTHLQNKTTIPRTINGLYKGIIPPLGGITIEKFIVFGVYQTIINNQEKMTYTKIGLAGFISGAGATAIVTPCERWKILLQTNQTVNIRELGIKGLYQGFTPTLFREPLGYTIYFTMYEYLKRNYTASKKIQKHESFIFGGIAGISAWVFIYPGERCKTIIQSSKQKITMRNAFITLYNDGISNLYRGFSAAAIRAGLTHGIVFTFNEIFSSYRR